METERGFGKRLILLRGERTQTEVATALGLAPSSIGMYEREERTPSDANKLKLAEYFNSSVAFIFFNEECHYELTSEQTTTNTNTTN